MMKMAAATAEVRTKAMAAVALVMITLVTLAIAHFVACHVVANPIARRHRHHICQHETKRAMARVAKAMGTATTKVLETVARAKATQWQ